jgi:hypothetical protein
MAFLQSLVSSNIKLVVVQPGTTTVSGGGVGNHHPGVVVLVEVDRVVVQSPSCQGLPVRILVGRQKIVDRGGGGALGRVHEKWVAGQKMSLLQKGLHRRSRTEGGNF